MTTITKCLAAVITLAALIAVGVSSYLAWVSWQAAGVAGCTADGVIDCDTVLTSRWSHLFSIPVAAVGALAYLALVVVVWPAANNPRSTAMSLLLALAMAAVAAALWFVGLQLFQLQSFCLYCLAVHACGLTIAGCAVAMYSRFDPYGHVGRQQAVVGTSIGQIPSLVASRRDDEPVIGPAVACAFAGVGIVVLIGGQMFGPDSSTTAISEIKLKPVVNQSVQSKSVDNAPDFMENQSLSAADEEAPVGPQRLMGFAGLPSPIDTHAMPMLGDPDAEHVIVEMIDYTCKHCRQMHPRLQKARERYGDDLGIVICHVPLSVECNDHFPPGKKGRPTACEYARMAINVWQHAPEHFVEFHEFLMEGRSPPPLGEAKQRAMSLAGAKVLLDDRMKSGTINRLRKQCDAWSEFDSGLPILLFGDTAVTGGGKTDEELFANLEQRLGIEPKPSASE